ncbi:MAG: UPF0182 family protein [Propionibacteriaceae bacterium]|nr:UPF0182 family protein [Propionibacteriaceae bacterium]
MASATVSTNPAKKGRGRALIPTVLIVIALAWLYVTFTTVWTDHLWFDALGYNRVFVTQLLTKIALVAGFGLVMGLVVGLTVWLVVKSQPSDRSLPRPAEAYRQVIDGHKRLVVLIPAVLFAFFGGASGIGQAPTFLAWANQEPFGVTDPRFGLDVSFYVFDYPWYSQVLSFLLVTVGLAIAVALFGHFVLGGLAAPTPRGRVSTKAAHRHVALLAAVFFVVYGFKKLLDRYGELLVSGDLLDGLSYTGDHAQIGAHTVMAVISWLTAGLFVFAAFWRPNWRLPITSVVLMVVSSIIVGMVYPAFVQSFQVNPTRPDKERPYVEYNIAATRSAYGIEEVEIADYSATTTVAAGQLKSDAEALPGIRLIDPAMVQQTFEQLQQVRGYYSFAPVLDVDRYVVNGKETDVVVAAREMNQSGLPSSDWNNIHTVYTHGYGLVAAYGNRRQSDGEPDWIARDIPTVGDLKAEQPRIYFGELADTYAVVGRTEGQEAIEFDTPGGGQSGGEQYNTYDGETGVPIGGLVNRVLYATRFASMNLLLSDRVNENSRILYDRTPRERVQQVAPWLTIDSDVYPAIVSGRIVWIVDCYTTSASYPNSYRTTISEAISDTRTNANQSALRPTDQINYIRNSVKATVDAYTGQVTLYAWEPDDPVLKTWMKVYPGTVTDRSQISGELMAHLRYPSDLFKIQRQVLRRYHMTDPQQWYQQSDLWNIPNDPVRGVAQGGTKEPAYYLSIKWPEITSAGQTAPADESPLFSLTTVYTPNNRENLSAYMSVVAEATNQDYGRIRVLRMSDTQQIEGPGQAFNSITGNEQVASLLRPYLNQGSAAASYGNLLTIPLGGGLLYVQPIYTQREGTNGSFPVLRYVVVRFGNHVGIAETLQGALDQVFSGDAGADTGEGDVTPPDPTDPTTPDTEQTRDQIVQSALAEAEAQFQAAQEALRQGDLAAYQRANQQAAAAVQRAAEAMAR